MEIRSLISLTFTKSGTNQFTGSYKEWQLCNFKREPVVSKTKVSVVPDSILKNSLNVLSPSFVCKIMNL